MSLFTKRLASRRFVLSAAALLTTAGTLGAGLVTSTSASAKTLPTVSVGIALTPPKVVFITPYVAQAMGFFTKEGVKANFVSMPNGLSTELGATSGSINFGLSSGTDSIEAAAAGAPIQAIGSYATRLDTECVALNGYTTAAELRGQNVGTTGAGGFAATTLAACLKPLGLTLADVHPVVMTRSQFVGAMATGAIKMASFHADDAYVVLHSIAGTKVVNATYKALPNWWYGGISSLDGYTRLHPLTTEHFLAALMLADKWINNPKNFTKLVKMAVGWTGESAAAVTYALHFNINAQTFSVATPFKAINWTSNECKVVGDTSIAPSYNEIVNDHYLSAATALLAKG